MSKTVKVGIYARVSTGKQDTENQLGQLREFARNQEEWTVSEEYVEVVSGSGKRARAEFDKMMLGASQKKFDMLVFWALDRFYQHPHEGGATAGTEGWPEARESADTD